MRKDSAFLGKEPIKKLLWKLTAPAAVGMLSIALYNIADAIFIGQGVGVAGIASVAIAFPLFIIFMAFAQTIGMGGASIVSRRLGEGKKKLAQKTTWNVFFLSVILSVVFGTIGLIFLKPLLLLFGASAEILPYSMNYMSVLLYGILFMIFSMSANNIARSEGNAKVAMISILIGIGTNIILDPIFIFVFGWGMKGAALATILAQLLSSIYLLRYFFDKKNPLPWHGWCLQWSLVKEISAIGFPSFIRQSAGSISVAIINHGLVFYGGTIAVAAFGIINRLLAFTLMPMFGIIQGMQPIVGFNFGAKKLNRTKHTIKLSTLWASSVATIAFLILWFLGKQIIPIFSNDAELLRIGFPALRMTILVLPIVGIQIIGAGLFQALGKKKEAIILSLLRQVILLIPLVLILPKWFGLAGIFLAFPIADFIGTIVTGGFILKLFKELKDKIPL